MRLLIGWDDAAEAELISLYLNATDDQAVVTTDSEELVSRARCRDDDWDVILMTTGSGEGDADGAFEIFETLRQARPDCPIVGACHSQDVFWLARFITNGMRSYVLRDVGGDFVFLLQSTLESTVAAVRAEREQQIAERMREEIESVRRFQESLLPQQIYAPRGYRIAGCYEPSQIRVMGGQPVILAGGDYYDVFQLDRKNLVLVVADAAGHGMRACMSIMIMQTLMRLIRGRLYRKTADFVGEINRRFCEQRATQQDGSLVTLLYGVLRIDKHTLHWSSAGHPVPLLHDCRDVSVEPVESNEAAGPPLGVDSGMSYKSYKVNLPRLSRLLLYTDGLVEAYPDDDAARQFGVEGVRKTMLRTGGLPVADTLQALLNASHDFTEGTGRHDDTSALLLERK